MAQNGRTYDPKGALRARYLIVGFVCTALLSVLTVGVAALEVSRVESEALKLAEESQQATYYIGSVGEQVSRLRSNAALGLGQPPEEFSRRAGRIKQIDANLREAIDKLTGDLDGASQRRWASLKPEIEHLRRIYSDAAALLQAGQSSRASELISREAADTARVHDGLQNLAWLHREQVTAALKSARQRTSDVRVLEAILGGIFFAGILVIWGGVSALLRGQRRQLAEYTLRLESANADLDAFAGRVAHDLKNALAPIMMAPEVLRLSQENPTRCIEIAERMQRSADRAIALIDALLTFSRASHGVDGEDSAAVQSTVRNALEELAPQVARGGVSVEVGEIPNLRVRCSPGLLHVVLSNLFGNAVKFLEGQDTRQVRISVRREESSCRIAVEDTGPGIPGEALARIFEPFYRVAGNRAPGIGIGLATARRIVQAYGGHITVESSEGHGSRFEVSLPLAAPLEDDPAEAVPAVRSPLPG